jgi:thioredoxin reductase
LSDKSTSAKWLAFSAKSGFAASGFRLLHLCQHHIYRESSRLVSVEGGDTAVKEALFLSELALKVPRVHRDASRRVVRDLQ